MKFRWLGNCISHQGGRLSRRPGLHGGIRIGRLAILGLILCGTFLGWVVPVQALTLHATDDTDINVNKTKQNNGDHAQLFVRNVGSGGERQGFVKFDLSPLPAGPTIDKVTLRLFPNKIQQAGNLTLHEVLADWDEAIITAGTAPPLGAALQIVSVTSEKKDYVAIELPTSLVQSWVDNPASNFGLALLPDDTNSVRVQFDSKESGATSHPAELEVVLLGPEGPQGATGPEGSQGPQGATGPEGPQGVQGPTGPTGSDGVISDGNLNTRGGTDALASNTTGFSNTAYGVDALKSNIDGRQNTAIGTNALEANISGQDNIAIGKDALKNATGDENIAFGEEAGVLLAAGDNNIYISTPGRSNESDTIRIGEGASYKRTVISGIVGVTPPNGTTVAVFIDQTGQLGTVSSSRRYKEDIHDMASASQNLLALRPVTFRYKQAYADGTKPIQYGLIAEEVVEVFPDLVVYDDEGQVETVQYHKLVPMLLNELQKEHANNLHQTNTITQQAKQIDNLKAQMGVVETQNRQLKEVMARLTKLEKVAKGQREEILQTRLHK